MDVRINASFLLTFNDKDVKQFHLIVFFVIVERTSICCVHNESGPVRRIMLRLINVNG